MSNLPKKNILFDCSGSIAIKFALLMPVVFGAAALAIDYSWSASRQAQLQQAVDSAALAAVNELHLVSATPEGVQSVARDMTIANLKNPGDVQISATVSDTALTVTAKEQITSLLAQIMNYPKTEIQATAVANASATKLCMIALESKNDNAVSLKSKSQLTALECSIYSNSRGQHGLKVEDSAQVTAEMVCSAGGIDGQHGHFSNKPLTDCPAMTDPLADRQPPSFYSCDFNNTEIKGKLDTLDPGVYCGGLKVTGGSVVTLSPGIYIVQGGQLKVDQNSTMTGTDVGFYLAGPDSNFVFDYDSSISLAAPKTGVMAGLLFFDDRAGKYNQHQIYSNDARVLLGTIYLPNGSLFIDSHKPIADKSAYTVLVTRTLELRSGPNLFLNSDYSASAVPVPKGLGPIGLRPRLIQ